MDAINAQQQLNLLVMRLKMIIQPEDLEQFKVGQKKLLIVEGLTDKQFMENIKKEDVICQNVNFITCNDSISNCKKVIIDLLDGLYGPPILFKRPKGSENWKVFGMIDKDYDEYQNKPKCFMTDTHDLETLMLSTAEDLLQKILLEKIVLPVIEFDIQQQIYNDVEKALFLAYQLGTMRKLLIGKISLYGLSVHEGEPVDYSAFVDGDRISLKKLISYLNKRLADLKEKLLEQLSKKLSPKEITNLFKQGSEKKKLKEFFEQLSKKLSQKEIKKLEALSTKLSAGQEDKLFNQLSEDKSIRNCLDIEGKEEKEGKWNLGIDLFGPTKTYNWWDIINGHDVLLLLRYINDTAATFSNPQKMDFETALIKNYDPENFEGTKICRRMREAGIVKDNFMAKEN